MKVLPEYLKISRIPVWIKRIQGYIHKEPEISNMNFQNQQANIAIVRGGLLELGLEIVPKNISYLWLILILYMRL